jgi:hypothetical protein
MGLAHSPSIISDGLVFYLDAANRRSYSGSGLTINGLVGGIGGTLVNGVGFTSSNNGVFTFDGANDSIDLGDNFDMGLSSFTICTYFRLSATTFLHGIFSKSIAAAASSRYAVFIYNYGAGYKISTFMSNGGLSDVETPSVLTVATNTWYHISAVYNRADKVYLYINGVLDSSATISQFQAVDFQSSYNFRIGAYGDASNNPNYFLNGSLSQFQIYNRALSSTEILQNYNATRKRFGL